MFDTYRTGPTNIHANVSVTEKRAPTDQSVALLREMEKAARDSVDSTIRLNTNNIKAVIHKETDFANYQYVYIFHVDFNGTPLRGKVFVDVDDDRATVVGKLFKEISEEITVHIMSGFDANQLFR